jgi:hypothetical protein
VADGHDHRYSDAANRASDTIRLHIIASHLNGVDCTDRWVAIRLSDGGSDGVLYDTRRDAINHQLHEKSCAYIRVPPDDVSPRAAEAFLNFVRQAHDAGMPLADPEVEIHTPQQTYDSLVQGGFIHDPRHPGNRRARP